MRNRFLRFMAGRYGQDELNRVILFIALVLLILSMFQPMRFLYVFALLILVYAYFRMFSRNITKRSRENQWYLDRKYRAVSKCSTAKKHWSQRKIYRFYRCPGCKQTVRVPRGKGRIEITCPRCRTSFVRRS